MGISGIDIEAQAEAVGVEMRRVVNECCYHCVHSQPMNGKWICTKHDIEFGSAGSRDEDEVTAVSWMAEYTCVEWSRI